MIHRLRKIANNFWAGSAPTPLDVLWLKKHLKIERIVSLDQETGDAIDQTCKSLKIEHIKSYIDDSRKSLTKFLKHNLKELFLSGKPTFVHCREGKDRTGLAVALLECKYLDKSPEKAIQEAKSLGFGVGVPEKVIKLYEKLIRSCKNNGKQKIEGNLTDSNNVDIVSNERSYKSDNRDSYLDEAHQGSFAPYLDHTRQNPQDSVYNYITDQSPTRENYYAYKHPQVPKVDPDCNSIPQVGIYDNDAGLRGVGPSENLGGFFTGN